MKEKLLDKITEMRDSLKSEDVTGSRMNNFEAFENGLRSIPVDGYQETNGNELTMLLDQAKKLEQDFEHSHPHFSATFKEVVRMLSDMGI